MASGIIICGPPGKPAIRDRVSMKRSLDDGGFGSCIVVVKGLYGEKKERIWCSFSAFGKAAWDPTSLPPRPLSWLEKRIKTWDSIWPDAQWQVRRDTPWRNETWVRVKPGRWEVAEVGDGFA